MANAGILSPDFESYLAGRGITRDAYEALPDEKRRYLVETWQWEQRVVSPPPTARNLPEASTDLLASPARLRPLWVAAAACVLLVAAVTILGNRQRSGGAEAGREPTARTARSTTPPPTETPGLGTWMVVAQAQGRTGTTTPAFGILGPKWRVIWSTKPAPGRPEGSFEVHLDQPGGPPERPAVSFFGAGEGSMTLRGGGNRVLRVVTDQSYQVKVLDYR